MGVKSRKYFGGVFQDFSGAFEQLALVEWSYVWMRKREESDFDVRQLFMYEVYVLEPCE